MENVISSLELQSLDRKNVIIVIGNSDSIKQLDCSSNFPI